MNRMKCRWSYLGILVLCVTVWPVYAGAQETLDLEGGLHKLAESLGGRMTSRGVKKLAVVEFSDLAGYESALGLFVAEELTTRLLETEPGGFDIVERQQLNKVLTEQSLTANAIFDAETIASVGAILGIQGIVTGSMADLGDSVKINARCISVETALVFAAASISVPKKGVVDHLLRQGAAPNLTSQPGQARSGGRRVQASDVFFQNSFLRITVDSLAVSKEKDRAILGLSVENLLAQEVRIAAELGYQKYCQVRLVGDDGSELRLGYREIPSGLGCLASNDSTTGELFTSLSPKSRTTVVLGFERKNSSQQVTGTVFSVGLSLLRFQDGKISRFSAGLSNIEASTPSP